jgi:hypothetical protein
MTDVDFFFTPPNVEPALCHRADQSYSVLYLLRREAQDCGDDSSRQRLD